MDKKTALQNSDEVILFIKKAISKKQDLLSTWSRQEDAEILSTVEHLQKKMKNKDIILPVEFCEKAFARLNYDYAERNVACTGIGALGCFLIDYLLTYQKLSIATKNLYRFSNQQTEKKLRQNEWYNYAIGRIFDLALDQKNKTNIIEKRNVISVSKGREKE
ncbi:MAG: hypothetical protein J6V53_06330 [Alphaproteobacteria bacterium]|nr:hypothetical protein [Alphaproteobacteria bacterium]